MKIFFDEYDKLGNVELLRKLYIPQFGVLRWEHLGADVPMSRDEVDATADSGPCESERPGCGQRGTESCSGGSEQPNSEKHDAELRDSKPYPPPVNILDFIIR